MWRDRNASTVAVFMSKTSNLSDPSVRRRLFSAAASAMFVFGMIIAMLGALFGLPAMRERLAIDLAQQGQLFSILAIGLLASTAVVGPTIDRFGSKVVMVSASAMVTAALLAFAMAQGFGAAALAALLLGIGGGWLNTATNALVSDVFHDDRGRMLNLLGTFFGLGALFVPAVIAVSFGALSVSGTMVLCAAVAAASLAFCAAQPFPPAHEGAAFSFGGMLAVAKDRGVLLFAGLLLFQSGNEAALSGWTSTYVGSVGWSPRVATVILLGYWVTAVVGRAVSARAQAWTGKERLVAICGGLSVAGCIVLLAAAASLPALAIGALLTSLGFSAIFPTMLAIAGDRYHRFAGTVFGLLFTVGNLGSITFPWAVGEISQAFGVRLGMIVPLAGTVGVTALALVVLSTSARPRAS
jgi:MFS transporter, FHS family, glucose/mannose:H+ symporter